MKILPAVLVIICLAHSCHAIAQQPAADPLCVSLSGCDIPAPDTPCDWSGTVNGIKARICLARSEVHDGSPLIFATLTLRNETPQAISVGWILQAMSYTIVDDHGAPVTTGINVGGMPSGGNGSAPGRTLVIAPGNENSFQISGGGGVTRDKVAVLQLGGGNLFAFEPTEHPLFLRAAFQIAEPQLRQPAQEYPRTWFGRIAIPDVRIPLGLEPASPARFAATLADAGAAIAAGERDKSIAGTQKTIAALNRLTLLNDLRVVPLYMKAFGIPDYSIKFRVVADLGALLRRYPDGNLDELLAGLARASRTTAEDLGSARNVGSAASLRDAVAVQLSFSANPAARQLLKTMESDPDQRVRDRVARGLAER